ncbi:MAG: hypothetical protein U0P45_01855 [Acidimicrobiales bacterium]
MPSDPSLPPTPALDPVVARFLAGTASAEEWDHAAHVRAFAHLLRAEPSTDAAYERMRSLILAHNARVSPNGEHGRYHETVTRYYVAAVAAAMEAGRTTDAELLEDPALDREAPLRHWSRDLLLSEEVRATWAPPDLAPLPWPVDGRGAPAAPCRCA